MKHLTFGLVAEHIVIWCYRLKFYKILHHRWRKYSGEIDVIACRNQQLVFIEVKARKHVIYEDIISFKQQARIKRTAELFLSHRPKYAMHTVRFDLAIVEPYKLPQIIENAW